MTRCPAVALLCLAALGTASSGCASARDDGQEPPKPVPASVADTGEPGEPGESLALVYDAREGGRILRLRQPAALRVQSADGPRPRLFEGLRLRSREEGPRLGVMLEDTPDGLRIDRVLEGSLAESAGVQAGDVLLRVGGQRVNGFADVGLALREHSPGDEVVVAVIRPGEGIVELTGTLPEAKPEPRAPPARIDGFRGGFLGVELKPEGDTAGASGEGEGGEGMDAGPDGTAGDGDAAGDTGDAAGTAGVALPGVEVAGVVPESAAWYAGIEAGDRLLALDGKTLASAEDLVGAVSAKEPGTLIELNCSRGGEEHTVRVRLGHRSPIALMPGLRDPSGLWSLQGPGGSHLLPGPPGTLAPGLHDLPGIQDIHIPLRRHGGIQGPFGLDGATSRLMRVEIRDGEMLVDRDGVQERYRRNDEGGWDRIEGESQFSDDDASGPRLRDG